MTDPLLSVRASGYGGRGYAIPTRLDENGKPIRVPGITTVTGALEKGGVVQWAVDQTAAYAVANASSLAERDEDWGFKRLRYYHSRKPDYDNPETNLNNYHVGVLDDLANQGNIIHEAVEAYVKGDFGPAFTRYEQEEAFLTFVEWAEDNEIEFLASEATVFDPDIGYAGTGDLWVKFPNEDVYYLDVKSARKVHDSHVMQGAAIVKAPLRIEASDKGVEHKGQKWVETPAIKTQGAGVLQVRQRSIDEYGNEIPAFTKLHLIPNAELEPAYEMFKGALQVRHGQRKLKDIRKEREKNEWF